MQLGSKHFTVSNPRNLHFSHEPPEHLDLEDQLRKIAKSLRYHFAFMDGTDIRDGNALRSRLATIYAFPGVESGAIVRHGWDGTRDWLADLTWLTGWPPGGSGVSG